MKEPLRNLRPVADHPEVETGCKECRSLERKLKAAEKKIEELQTSNDRLIRAIQRESHHMDVRADHHGHKSVLGK